MLLPSGRPIYFKMISNWNNSQSPLALLLAVTLAVILLAMQPKRLDCVDVWTPHRDEFINCLHRFTTNKELNADEREVNFCKADTKRLFYPQGLLNIDLKSPLKEAPIVAAGFMGDIGEEAAAQVIERNIRLWKWAIGKEIDKCFDCNDRCKRVMNEIKETIGDAFDKESDQLFNAQGREDLAKRDPSKRIALGDEYYPYCDLMSYHNKEDVQFIERLRGIYSTAGNENWLDKLREKHYGLHKRLEAFIGDFLGPMKTKLSQDEARHLAYTELNACFSTINPNEAPYFLANKVPSLSLSDYDQLNFLERRKNAGGKWIINHLSKEGEHRKNCKGGEMENNCKSYVATFNELFNWQQARDNENELNQAIAELNYNHQWKAEIGEIIQLWRNYVYCDLLIIHPPIDERLETHSSSSSGREKSSSSRRLLDKLKNKLRIGE